MHEEVVLYAVRAEDVTTFTEEMTGEVKEAVPRAASLILEEIRSRQPSAIHSTQG
jgi:Ni,Fe-hydrogenase maturation factor